MVVGIMQPYFMPYIGYFQLINSVDEFIIYDNIQYTKKDLLIEIAFYLMEQTNYSPYP
jgi:hypothetical protein